MADVKVELNRRAVAALLRSPEILAEVDRRARRIATAAGAGMEVESQLGRTRARASIVTATGQARAAEARDRRLSAALNAGR